MLTEQEQAKVFKLAEQWVKAERLRIRTETGHAGKISRFAAERMSQEVRAQFRDSLKEVG